MSVDAHTMWACVACCLFTIQQYIRPPFPRPLPPSASPPPPAAATERTVPSSPSPCPCSAPLPTARPAPSPSTPRCPRPNSPRWGGLGWGCSTRQDPDTHRRHTHVHRSSTCLISVHRMQVFLAFSSRFWPADTDILGFLPATPSPGTPNETAKQNATFRALAISSHRIALHVPDRKSVV